MSDFIPLRELLDEPRPLPRKTWPKLIRLLRARKKRTGEAPVLLHGNGDLQRGLQMRPKGDLSLVAELRPLLDGMHRADLEDATWQDRASQADALFGRLTPRIRIEPVAVTVTGWHPLITQEVRDAVVGHAPLAAMRPVDAAVLVHELDGLNLGGHLLAVDAPVEPGATLPAPPRDRRGGPRRRGDGSWLPNVDAVGRWSTTPRHIADAHADVLQEAGVRTVIDPFCGCGADAIRFALAGITVHAVECEPGRAAMARRNASSFGVTDHLTVHQGDGVALLPKLLAENPDAAIFLDPPWGGAEAQDGTARELRDWTALLALGGPNFVVPEHAPLLLKLPRDFAIDTLPEGDWVVDWHRGAEGSGAERVIKTISALRR